MQYRPDIVISDRFGAPVAIIEVKALNHAGVHTAARYLRNLLAHGLVPQARFVLLITPDTGYLWSTPGALLQDTPPALTFPMDRIVQHYVAAGGATLPVHGLVLESIAHQWLADLADGVVVDAETTSRLEDIGFVQAVRDGLVNVHSPA